MKEHNILAAFGKSLVETPLAIILFILDLIGVVTVIYLVVDDYIEAGIVVAFLLVLLTSQYLVYRKMWRETQGLPAVKFVEVRQAQLHRHSEVAGHTIPIYNVVQAWFANNPTVPSESSVAREVTAKITVYSLEDEPILSFYGQWADSNAPDNVGYNGFYDRVNIPPGHLRAKLLIALKYQSNSDGYCFTKEGMRETTDGRFPAYVIRPGEYIVRVHLNGIGVDGTHCFKLTNQGRGQVLELEQTNCR